MMKSKLRLKNGKTVDVVAKPIDPPAKTQKERDAEVARKFAARLAGQDTASKADTSGGK